MQALKELIGFLDRYKVRHIEVLTNTQTQLSKQENRYFECYAGIREGRWQTEEEMAAHFGLEAGSKAFTRFKNEVKKRLLNSVLFIDTNAPEYSEYSRATIALNQQLAVANTLATVGLTTAYIEMAFRLLDIAIRFEVVPTIVEVSRLLRKYLLPYPEYEKEYQRAVALYQQYFPAYLAEMRVRDAYESVMRPTAARKGLHRELAQQAADKVAELASDVQRYDHLSLRYPYYLLQIFASSNQRNWTEALQSADEALNFLDGKSFEHRSFRLGILTQRAQVELILGHYELANNTLAEALNMTQRGMGNWFKIQELVLLNMLYAGHYREAWTLLRDVTQHPRHYLLSAINLESWRLYQGYLYLMVRLGKIEVSPREKGEVEKFRLSSWLNDLPLHSQDKRGANIPLLILQALFLLHADDTDAFDNRVEALRKYRQRNLEPDGEHWRTDCFVRLLELATRHAHQPHSLQHAAAPLLKRLQNESPDLLNSAYEVEVVPYERQWAWVVEMLSPVAV